MYLAKYKASKKSDSKPHRFSLFKRARSNVFRERGRNNGLNSVKNKTKFRLSLTDNGKLNKMICSQYFDTNILIVILVVWLHKIITYYNSTFFRLRV